MSGCWAGAFVAMPVLHDGRAVVGAGHNSGAASKVRVPAELLVRAPTKPQTLLLPTADFTCTPPGTSGNLLDGFVAALHSTPALCALTALEKLVSEGWVLCAVRCRCDARCVVAVGSCGRLTVRPFLQDAHPVGAEEFSSLECTCAGRAGGGWEGRASSCSPITAAGWLVQGMATLLPAPSTVHPAGLLVLCQRAGLTADEITADCLVLTLLWCGLLGHAGLSAVAWGQNAKHLGGV